MEDKFGQMDLRIKINKKVSAKELNKIMKSILNFNITEWETQNGEECIIMFTDEIDNVIFSDFNKDKYEIYTEKEACVKGLLKSIFNCIDSNECLIIKENEKWITNRKKGKLLDRVLRENEINNRGNCGIYVSKNSPIIPLFVEATLRYYAFVAFVFEKEKLIIAPSDHMDIFIFYEKHDIYSIIKECVEQYNHEKHVFGIAQRS